MPNILNERTSQEYIVYKHTCPNDKVYIGITKLNPSIRWGKQGRNYRGQVFFYAIKKYGWDNIKHEILYTDLSKEEAEQKEIELIAIYKSNQAEFGYNIDNGGNCGGTRSQITREKISKSLKNTLNTAEGRKTHSNASRGRKRSEEWKQKMRVIRSQYKVTEETKRKISQANRGKKHTEERNKRIGEKLSIPILCVELNVCFQGQREAERQLKIANGSICKCLKGITNTAGGFHWKYVERG